MTFSVALYIPSKWFLFLLLLFQMTRSGNFKFDNDNSPLLLLWWVYDGFEIPKQFNSGNANFMSSDPHMLFNSVAIGARGTWKHCDEFLFIISWFYVDFKPQSGPSALSEQSKIKGSFTQNRSLYAFECMRYKKSSKQFIYTNLSTSASWAAIAFSNILSLSNFVSLLLSLSNFTFHSSPHWSSDFSLSDSYSNLYFVNG